MVATPGRPAFYALGRGRLQDAITLLHPPYTAWHLSYFALGAAVAPHVHLAIRGTISRAEIREVIAATYHQVWWPTAEIKYAGAGTIEFLYDNGARLDVRNKKGQLPLTIAADGDGSNSGVQAQPKTAALFRKLMGLSEAAPAPTPDQPR